MMDEQKPRTDSKATWITAATLVGAQLVSVICYMTGTNAAVSNVQISLNSLANEVHQLAQEVNRLALANERVQEHNHAIDRRIEQLETSRK